MLCCAKLCCAVLCVLCVVEVCTLYTHPPWRTKNETPFRVSCSRVVCLLPLLPCVCVQVVKLVLSALDDAKVEDVVRAVGRRRTPSDMVEEEVGMFMPKDGLAASAATLPRASSAAVLGPGGGAPRLYHSNHAVDVTGHGAGVGTGAGGVGAGFGADDVVPLRAASSMADGRPAPLSSAASRSVAATVDVVDVSGDSDRSSESDTDAFLDAGHDADVDTVRGAGDASSRRMSASSQASYDQMFLLHSSPTRTPTSVTLSPRTERPTLSPNAVALNTELGTLEPVASATGGGGRGAGAAALPGGVDPSSPLSKRWSRVRPAPHVKRHSMRSPTTLNVSGAGAGATGHKLKLPAQATTGKAGSRTPTGSSTARRRRSVSRSRSPRSSLTRLGASRTPDLRSLRSPFAAKVAPAPTVVVLTSPKHAAGVSKSPGGAAHRRQARAKTRGVVAPTTTYSGSGSSSSLSTVAKPAGGSVAIVGHAAVKPNKR